MKLVCSANVSYSPQQIRESEVFKQWAATTCISDINEVMVYAVQDHGGHISCISIGITTMHNTHEELELLRAPMISVLTVLAAPKSTHLVFVKRIRPTVDRTVISNPTGTCEPKETPAIAAARIAQSATGISAHGADIMPLINLVHNTNPDSCTDPYTTNQHALLYLARIQVSTAQYNKCSKQQELQVVPTHLRLGGVLDRITTTATDADRTTILALCMYYFKQ